MPPAGYFGPGSDIPGAGQAAGGGYTQNLWAAQSAAADPNAAAWAAYYQQYYGQMAGMGAPGAAGAPAGAPAATATVGGADPSKAGAAAGQSADYSQQWIEYYRSLGMHDQADAILKQIQAV